MLKKFLIVKMPDNTEWAISADIIARNRADFLARCCHYAEDPKEVYQREFQATIDDPYTLMEWARKEMTWDFLSKHARQINPPPGYYHAAFKESEMRFHTYNKESSDAS